MTTNEAADALLAELAPMGVETVCVEAASWRHPKYPKRTVFTATIFPGLSGASCDRFESNSMAKSMNAALVAWQNRNTIDESGMATEDQPVRSGGGAGRRGITGESREGE